MRNPNSQRRVMDLPPPPPPLLRRHHHHLRYDNVLYPPDFIHPTLPPHAGQSLILLQPPPSRLSHIAHPSELPRFNCAPLRHPPLSRFHLYELGSPPKPYLHRRICPPPPPPASTLQNIHWRPSHWSGELYNKRDDVRRCGNGMNDNRDYGEKRWDNEKMDYDEMRQDNINGWIRGLYKNRDDHERRRGSGISDHGCNLYYEGANDERILNHGTNGAVLLGSGNRRPELRENASSLSRCSGRLRSGVSEEEPVRSKKKRRLQKKNAICRIESGKDCSKNKGGHNCQRLTKELSDCSLKGKANEGFGCLQTRMGSKRRKGKSQEHAISIHRSNALVAKGLLAPLCPDIKTDEDKRIAKTETRFSMPGFLMARSREDVVKTDLLACGLDLRYDSQGTSKELLDKAVVSRSESLTDDANDLGEIAVKNQLQKDMNLEGPTFESGSTRRNRLRRKRKAKKMRLHKISVQIREDIGDITNASDCITTSAFPRTRSDANYFGEIAVKNQPKKDMNLQCLTVGSGSTGRKNRKARKKLLHETSMEIRKDTGHIINANNYIIPLASPQPCSNANNIFEIDMNNLRKDMSLEGPTAVGSVSTRRRKRKGRKKLLRETSMQRKENSGCIINAIDCIIPSASLQPCSDTALPKRNLSDAFTRLVPEAVLLPAFGGIVTKEACSNCDSCNSFVPYLKRKKSSLTTLSASHYVSDSVISESSGHAEKLVTSSEDAEFEHDTHECFLANESTGHGDSLGFNQHDNNADKVVLNEVSVSDIEKSKIEPVDQYAKLGPDRVDDISEHPFHVVSPLLNSFVNGASKVMVSLEDNDITGSLQADRCTSEVHASNTSSKSVNALPLKPKNAIISEADENSEDVFLNKLNATLVVVNSEEFRSLEGVAISNDSNVTSTDFLEADQKGIIIDSLSPNYLSNKPFIDDIGSIEGHLEAISNTKTCSSVDCLSNIIRKRKDRGAQTGLFGTNAVFGTSVSGGVGRLLAKDLVPAMEIDFPGEEGSSKEVDKSNEWPSGVEYSTTELDLDANHPFPNFSKKRKVASPRSNFSSYLEDEMVANGLNSNCSRLYQGSTGLTELEYGKRDDIIFSRNTEPSACQSENEIIFGGENISNKKPVSLSPDLSLFPSVKSLENAVSVNSQINAELSRSLPEAKSEVVKKWNPVHGNQTLRKNQWTSASPKVVPGRHPLYISNSRNLQYNHVAKSRTWHRNGSSSVAAPEIKLQPSPLVQCHETKIVRTVPSSYTRKGNSLVRNPSPSGSTIGFQNSSCSSFSLTPLTDNLKNKQESDSQTGDTDAQSIMRTEQIKVSEMPCKTVDAWEERIKSPGVPECWADSINSSNHQCTLEEGNPEKKIMYVKRRSNQLIAASNSEDMSILGRDKIQASSSDGYYKRKKNQLVRGPSENHVEESNANGNSRRLVSRTSIPRTYTRRPYGILKHSKFSFVWKLHEIHSSEKDKTAMGPQKVLPHLCSWKRSTHWRTFMHALSTKPKKSSFSSQTLMLSKKRGAIYTRSTHGYSLRMSKVLSVGGSSLKWSKSIERNSKKANEEVTRAVAAAEKRKKENGALMIASRSRNNVSRKLVISIQLRPVYNWYYVFGMAQTGERIFRIGSERYKMDPTRRTLHRIIADKVTSSSVVLQTEKNVKRSYVPRRLLIGNEEYVRIGNGNQLVRDPKKRTRVLANEKVRWSLRTARLRLARKRKYCQFFTRFGKCNKDDGKCPYIHDPSKIAVCTKFLNGLCTNVDCKLTHKVIPERMEDCSYFLKGSCSKESCPYRHVIVKPVSAVCKNFLRGYCAYGNEVLSFEKLDAVLVLIIPVVCLLVLSGGGPVGITCFGLWTSLVKLFRTIFEFFFVGKQGVCYKKYPWALRFSLLKEMASYFSKLEVPTTVLSCPKKHTYACPAFEATGLCPKASTCKLHHPKKNTEKIQSTNEPKMVRGRYFDGRLVGDADVGDVAYEAVSTKGKDDLVFDEGNFPDYISLGVGDDEMDQTLASKDEVCDYVSLGDETDDLDDFDVLV
ncbi:hypothetical protein OROGR_021589 [Orobanche gracilis]